MIKSLELTSFRAFEHIKFENLGRANLILGGNNTGKTSVLEALVLMMGSGKQIQNLPATFRQPVKDDAFPTYWSFLAHDSDWKSFKISADENQLTERLDPNSVRLLIDSSAEKDRVVVQFQGNQVHIGGFPGREIISILSTRAASPAAVSELFNQIAPLDPENEDRLQHLLATSIEPRLKRLRYAKPKDSKTHLVYADLGNGPMLPFTQLGQAFSRTLEIYCEIFANQPKIILIDEIENGLFHEGLEDFWKGLFEVLEDQDVQLFATTHSRECMEAAHHAASVRKGYPLRFLRLDRQVDDPSKIVASSFGSEEMETAVKADLEMR